MNQKFGGICRPNFLSECYRHYASTYSGMFEKQRAYCRMVTKFRGRPYGLLKIPNEQQTSNSYFLKCYS